MARGKNKIVRVQDGPRLERLRVLLEAVTGESVTTPEAAETAIGHLLGALGEGDDVQGFSVRALHAMMAARTRRWVEDLAQTVATAVTRFLDMKGIPGELHVGLAEDGRKLAAVVIDTQQDPYPIADAQLPTIEA